MKSKQSKCPLCGSIQSKKVNEFTEILCLDGNSESAVLKCTGCNVCYLWPYISDQLIQEMYDKSYFTGVTDFGCKLDLPSSNCDYETEIVSHRISKSWETVKSLLKLAPAARTILDVGAATGDFLAVAKECGLSVAGIELSPYAASKAKEKYGFILFETGILEFEGHETYDIIHMNHVFEHFNSPHQVLDRLNSMLTPNGLIYVEVPFQFNFFELLKYRLSGKTKKFDVFSLHHPIFYKPDILIKMFNDHGFSCKKIRVFKWSRYSPEGFLGILKKILWLTISLFGQGLFIEAFFEKKSVKL